jgi:hypothetical protein
MADQVITRYGYSVRVVGRPPDQAIVQKWGGSSWLDVKTFDTRSDDMAWHNAREHADKIFKQC